MFDDIHLTISYTLVTCTSDLYCIPAKGSLTTFWKQYFDFIRITVLYVIALQLSVQEKKEEETNSAHFTPMPCEHYMELTQLIMDVAAGDVPRADQIRTIIKVSHPGGQLHPSDGRLRRLRGAVLASRLEALTSCIIPGHLGHPCSKTAVIRGRVPEVQLVVREAGSPDATGAEHRPSVPKPLARPALPAQKGQLQSGSYALYRPSFIFIFTGYQLWISTSVVYVKDFDYSA